MDYELYDPIIEFCQQVDVSKFALGDLLGEICGPPSQKGKPNGSKEKLEAASEALARKGINYSPTYLRSVRDVSAKFPNAPCGAFESVRKVVSWGVAREFMSCPEVLIKWVESLDGRNATLTVIEAQIMVRNRNFNSANNTPVTTTTSPKSDESPTPSVSDDDESNTTKEEEPPTPPVSEEPPTQSSEEEPSTPPVETQPEEEMVIVVVPPAVDEMTAKRAMLKRAVSTSIEDLQADITELLNTYALSDREPDEDLHELLKELRDDYIKKLVAITAPRKSKSKSNKAAGNSDEQHAAV